MSTTTNVNDKKRVNQHDIIAEILRDGANNGDRLLEDDSKACKYNRDQLTRFYEIFVDRILDHLWQGDDVDLTRFAHIELVDQPSHKARDPYNGVGIEIPRRQLVKVRNRIDLNNVLAEVNEETGEVTRDGDTHPRVSRRRVRNERRNSKNDARQKVREANKRLRSIEARRAAHARSTEEEYARAKEAAEKAQRDFDAQEAAGDED